MRKLMKRIAVLMPAILLLVAMISITEEADASIYYYFKTPAKNASFKAGETVPVSFWCGVTQSHTEMDPWGNPISTTYEEMPATLRVYKGSQEIDSQEFTYREATTIETEYTPNVTGTLTLKLYGRGMGLGVTAQTLQDTLTINVKKPNPKAVKSMKPVITVDRIAKKKAVITCINNGGFGMKVYRAKSKSGKYKLIRTTSKSKFTDKKLSASKVYYYKVKLFAKNGKKKPYLSKFSKAVKAPKYSPSKDTSALQVIVTNTSKGVKISWKKYSKAGYYLVSRGTKNDGSGEVIACLDKADAYYIDKEAKKGKTYYYNVTAWYGDEGMPRVKSKFVKIKVQ